MFRPLFVVPVLALSLLAGCGSIADVLGTALEQTFPVHQPARTGSVSELGIVGAFVNTGDDAGNVAWRGFQSFEMAEPLVGYQLKEAKLLIRQTFVDGGPYAELAPMVIDRVELGLSLSAFDYHRVALATVAGVPNAALDLHEVDVTALIQNAIADGERVIDLRLRFLTPESVDADRDMAEFEPTALLTLEWEKLP